MADVFKDIVPSILLTKKNVLEDTNDYNAYLVNRSLSYHVDCIFYANEMNMNSRLDKQLQYQYLLNTIRPMKRKFQKWHKPTALKDIEYVKDCFGYSYEKAKQAMRILSDEQIALIKEKLDKGGVNK